jgi:ribosomal protein L7/L12
MQLFGSYVPIVIIVVLLLLPTVVRRIARRAGGAAGAAAAGRAPRADSAPSGAAQTATMPAASDAAVTVTFGAAVSQMKGELGVAEVMSLSTGQSVPTEVELELDAIGAPKRRVSAAVPAGLVLERGDRIYVLVEPGSDQTVSILPPSMTGGQSLPKGSNRLDAVVLGPQLLRMGHKASGIVKAAEPRPLANEALAARGMSKWYLELEVQPEQGWPYRAELTITLSTPEKAARIAHTGAEVQLRYDPEDPKTISIDSIAMGYGDPYASIATSVGAIAGGRSAAEPVNATATTPGDYKVVLVDGGEKKVHAIKTLRDIRPDLSLKGAKDIIESRWETSLLEGVSESQAQAIRAMFEKAGARVEVRQA